MITDYDFTRTSCAQFSDDRRYRYSLRRCFNGHVDLDPVNPVVFCMLNPSTADAFDNDPTVRRCIGFAQAWGHTDLIVVNLFAIRETNSKLLCTFGDPVGRPQNNETIANLPRCKIIAAWGSHPMARERAGIVLTILESDRLFCLRKTQGNAPGHPLYIPAAATLMPWGGY